MEHYIADSSTHLCARVAMCFKSVTPNYPFMSVYINTNLMFCTFCFLDIFLLFYQIKEATCHVYFVLKLFKVLLVHVIILRLCGMCTL